MFRIDLPASDSYLLLLPPIGSLSRWWQLGILSLALLIFLFLILRLYRYELSYIAKFYSRALLAIRLLIVGMIFLVTVMKPTIRRITQEIIPSHVIVAIDRSDSMAITDPQRDPIEKLQLARSLRLATDLAEDEKLKGWLEQLRQLNVPSDPAYRRVIERVDALSRRDLAWAVLSPEGLSLLATLGERHHLQVFGFHQQVYPLPPHADSMRSLLRTHGGSRESADTDLNLPLNLGLERRGDLKNGLVGIVVLSDGQHNRGTPPGQLAQQLGRAEGDRPAVPVYTVVCGARVPPPDLALASVKASPAIVFKHGSTNLDIRLQANNLPAGKIRLTVRYPAVVDLPERKPIVELIDYDGINQPLPRSIPVKMDRAAAERLVVTAEALDRDGNKADDRVPENNRSEVVVNVAPDKAKVLLIDGEARWEQHYLQTALARDETMQTESVVFEQPRLNLVRQPELASLKLPATKLPGPDELPRHDCIILGDVAPDQLSLDERTRLEKYVSERGGTLVILAGKRSMPMAYLDRGDPLARMLPITSPRLVDRKDGFKLALTGEGMQTDFLRLAPEAWLSLERWESLPKHYWAITGKAKENAIALAYVPVADRKAARDVDRESALIVRQNYGFGRVVYVGLDSTWRWRYKQGDRYHHQFWSSLIRWAASDRALTAGNDHVRFGVREPVYRGDQEIEMLARLGENAPKLRPDALIGARLLRQAQPDGPAEAVALVPLKPNPEVPGQFEARQANLPPGDYVMELSSPELGDKLLGPDGKNLRASFTVLATENGELLNLATDWERMKEIADKSGGLTFSADKADELIDKLKARTATRELPVDTAIAQSWWLLISLLLLLTTEWLMRKWVGLA